MFILFIPIITSNHDMILKACDHLCGDDFSVYYIILGTISTLLISTIFSDRFIKSLTALLAIDMVIYLLFPENTDYILPSKEDSLIWINLLYPFIYLIIKLIKKI